MIPFCCVSLQHGGISGLQWYWKPWIFFPITQSLCLFFHTGTNWNDSLNFPFITSYSRQPERAYLVGGFVWDPRPDPALLHSASECGWCSRPPPWGGSALLLNWPLWVCLPLYVSVSCMTAEWGRKNKVGDTLYCKHANMPSDSFEQATTQERSTLSLIHILLWSLLTVEHSLGSL